MTVGITINEHDIINFSIKDANGIHRYYEKEAVSNGEELVAIVDGKQIKLREAFHFEMIREHSKLSQKADEQSKPIGKFKDNAALQKAYESLEKEFTRRSQRLRELQKERENMQAEIIRLNDMKFTQEYCDLYKENEWLKAELKRQLAEHEEFTQNANAEIERLTKWKDKLQDTKNELKQQLIDTGFKEYCEENKRLTEENAELQKQVDELKKENAKVISFNDALYREKQRSVKGLVKEIYGEIDDSDILVVETQEYGEIEVVPIERLKEIIKSKGVEVE